MLDRSQKKHIYALIIHIMYANNWLPYGLLYGSELWSAAAASVCVIPPSPVSAGSAVVNSLWIVLRQLASNLS
jgi:hypothetical protein